MERNIEEYFGKWEDKPEVKKGNFGERIVKDYLEKEGYVVYTTKSIGSHLCDGFVSNKNKKEIFIGDVKSKARRNIYPDTGIDEKYYNNYKELSMKYNMPFFLYFIDEGMKKIYGNRLDVLEIERTILYEYDNGKGKESFPITYPSPKIDSKGNNIVYFPLCCMKEMNNITSEDVEILKDLSRRSIEYKPNQNEKITIIDSKIKEEINKVFYMI